MKNEAPERIWVKSHHGESRCGYWEDKPIRPNSPKNQGTEYIRADPAPSPAPDVREALRKVEAALADIAEGEPDPDDIAETIWCRERAAEGLKIARAALATQEAPND